LIIKKCFPYAVLLSLLPFAPACVTVQEHIPVPEELSDEARIPGIPEARIWGDEPPDFTATWLTSTKSELRERYPEITDTEHAYLAMSGGGANGAYGAGLMKGWTESGTRPEFTLVTGISTGALAAPFVFLGSEYDPMLERLFTTHSTKDLLKSRRNPLAMLKISVQATDPLKALIDEFVDETIMAEIAAEYRLGRSLLIGTTNLDASRPVIWKIGEIAASGQPGALELIRKILLASASIPAMFPPVHIDVEAGGGQYDELHVDGGTTSQVFVYPVQMDWSEVTERLGVQGRPRLYVIRNAKIDAEYGPSESRVISVMDRSITSLIRTQGIGDLYRIYFSAQREGIDFNLANIPSEFDEEMNELFDPVYMKGLFELGYSLAKTGYRWDKTPPNFDIEK
jgi:predicted acylesterase/phospholipase RssA